MRLATSCILVLLTGCGVPQLQAPSQTCMDFSLPREWQPPLEFIRSLPSQEGYLTSFGPSGSQDDSMNNYTDLMIEGSCLTEGCAAVVIHNVSDSKVFNMPNMLVPGQVQVRLRWAKYDRHRFYLQASPGSPTTSVVSVRFNGMEHVCF